MVPLDPGHHWRAVAVQAEPALRESGPAMEKPVTFGKLEIGMALSFDESQAEAKPDTPFRIAIMGDFSGRGSRWQLPADLPPIALKPVLIDRDNFDQVLTRLKPELHLFIGREEDPPISIAFSELEDFHPDNLFERLAVFQKLRETRRKLDTQSTYPDAAAEVKKWMGREAEPAGIPPEPPQKAPPGPQQENAGGLSLLDQIMTQSRDLPRREIQPSSDLAAYVQKIAKPHLIPREDPQKSELIQFVDETTTLLMREILHHPDFQALEAAWRAVYLLTSELETGTDLKLYLIDLPKALLAADLTAAEDLSETGLHRMLVEQSAETFGGEPWSLLVGNYSFDQRLEDIEILGRIAKIARHAGAPFIAAASPHVLGCDSLASAPHPRDWKRTGDPKERDVWELLRGMPEASCLGLALPRFLLRLPYGRETDAVGRFEFEEMDEPPYHENYLWGNPAFACALLIGRTFTLNGWDFSAGILREVSNLPMHVYKIEGESVMKPCAEVVLTEQAAEKILDAGLMLLVSFRERDIARLARLQSLARPPAALAGRWS